MKAGEILSINVENLAERQHEIVKETVIQKLKSIQEMIELEQYDQIEKQCGYSPAGDGYGENNYYIQFGIENTGRDDLSNMDIVQVCTLLMTLKKAAKRPEPSLSKLVHDDSPF